MHICTYLKSDVNTATFWELLCTYLKLFILETKYWRMNKPKLQVIKKFYVYSDRK